ncbi:MAG: YdeI/OmpD-associated family protein [Sphingomicrobium sp.]
MRATAEERHIPGGVVHDLPDDLKEALERDSAALRTWDDITPLARNEWICWIESAKKAETRTKRIDWGCENLRDGQRRPCCWPGCPHRGAAAKAVG